MTTDYWIKTKNMFSNLIDETLISDEYFQKPAPSYIFKLVMDTMEKTGFPKGLFSKKQQNFKYFKSNIEHKKNFFGKIIELINFIIDKEGDIVLSIDIKDILKGKKPEITNQFLQYFYNYATNEKDYHDIIQEYITNRNIEKYMYKNIEIPKGETINDKYYILWIDKDARNEKSQNFLKELDSNLQYVQIKNFVKICLNNVDNAFFLLRKIKFKIVYIIISGEFYPEYYHKLKNYKNILKCIPICVIHTTEELKNIYLKRYRHYLLNKEIYESINNSYYNYGGITSDFYSCLDFISNFYFSIKQKFFPKKEKDIKYEGNICFEKINSDIQLIVPFMHNELVSEENKISDNEMQYFKYILINRHGNDKVINLINPLLFTKGMPHELLLKFFIRAYSEKSSFFESINSSLNKKENKDYLTFVNLLFEGLANNTLSISEDDYLYRTSKMNKRLIEEIMEQFKKIKQNEDKSLPSFLLYSKSFLSFTKDKNNIKISKDNGDDDNYYNVVFKIINDDKIINKYTSNVDIEEISIFEEEKEILFLPFTTFILSNIHRENFNEEQVIMIELKYLGSYENLLKNYRNEEEKEKIKVLFNECFQKQNYIKELIDNKWLGDNDKDKKLKDKVLSKIKDKLKEKFGINFEDEKTEKEKEDKEENFAKYSLVKFNEFTDIEEKIKVKYKEKEHKILEINEEQLNLKDIEDNSLKKFSEFFIPYFKEENIEYIWTGKYNKYNEKEGKGKEYDLDDNLIFEGEYNASKRRKGTEYYIKIKGLKKYDGNYNNGIRWNGFLYDINKENKYEIKQGNGLIKEFYENGYLCYEGEIKNGIKDGKGKIYDQTGNLIFEGNFINGIKNGDGKEYNKNRELIFEGEFVNGNRMNGNIYVYNAQNELICETKFINGVYIKNKRKSIKDYKFELMINNELCLMEDAHIDKGVEYDISGEYKFEGEYKDGKKWNGKYKKLYENNKIFIEGEYKNGIKYWKQFNKFGKLIFEGKYERGSNYEGKRYKNGNLIFEGVYRNRKRIQGKEYNDEKQLVFGGTYKNGIRWNGQLKLYTKDFKLIFDGEIRRGKRWNGMCGQIEKGIGFEGIYKNGKKWSGSGIEPIRNGKKLFEWEILEDKNYKKIFDKLYNYQENKIIGSLVDGIGNNVKRFNNNNDLLSESDYYNGKCINGKEYNKFGETIYEGEYKDGKRYNGIYKIKINNKIFSYYYVNGKVINKYVELDKEILYEGEYSNNLKQGKGKEYNKQGKILFVGEFMNGYRYKGKEFNENGKLVFNGQYMKGIPYNGIRKIFIGNLLKFEGEIQNGLKIKGKEYDQDEKLIFEGEYKNGEKYKGREQYTPDLIFEGEYKDGTLYKGKDFDIQNRLRFEGEYKNGKRFSGKEYNESGELIFEGQYKLDKNPKTKIKENEDKKSTLKENKKDFIFEGEYKNGCRWNGKIIELKSNYLKIYENKLKNGLSISDLNQFFNNFNKHPDSTKIPKFDPKKDLNIIIKPNKDNRNTKNNNKFKDTQNIQNSQIISQSGIINQEEIKVHNNNSYEKIEIGNSEYNKDNETKYYLNNKLKYEKKIIDPNKYLYIEYDCNGQIIFEGEYLNKQKYKGKEYNIYGDIIFEGQYKYDERFNGDGYNNCSQFKYVNGKIEGNIVVYNFSKHELFEGEYKNGEKYNGILKTYFDSTDFILKRVIHIKDGQIYGKGKEYYKNNKLKYIGEFKNGEFNGKGTLYYEFLGYINYIGDFKNGRKNGLGLEYDKFGNILHKGKFEDGEFCPENS